MANQALSSRATLQRLFALTPLIVLPAAKSQADIVGSGDNTTPLDQAHQTNNLVLDLHEVVLGQTGEGLLDVTAGSSLHTQAATIGDANSSHGIVTVNGAGSSWTLDTLIVGKQGTGELFIRDGAKVDALHVNIGTQHTLAPYVPNEYGFIPEEGTGTITVDGAGSQLIVNNRGKGTTNFILGSMTSKNPTLNILNGGLVDAQDAVIYGNGGNSHLHFNNGTLLANSIALPKSLTGTGTIHTFGEMGRVGALTFNPTTGNQYTKTLADSEGQVTTMHVDLSGTKGLGRMGFMDEPTSNLLVDAIDVHVSHLRVGSNFHAEANAKVTITNQGELHVSTSTGMNSSGPMDFIIEQGGQLVGGSFYFEGDGSPQNLRVRGQGSKINLTNGGLYFNNNLSAFPGHLFELSNMATAEIGTIQITDPYANIHIKGNGTHLNTLGELRAAAGFRLEDGATLISNTTVIENTLASLGHAQVTGDGTHWTNTNSFVVGEHSNSTLVISDGAEIQSGEIKLGTFAGSNGNLSVKDASTRLTTQDLRVGGDGIGQLSVNQGAFVQVNQATHLSPNASFHLSGAGTVFVGGNAFHAEAGSNLHIDNQATLLLNGDLNFANGLSTSSKLHVNGGILDMQNHDLSATSNGVPYELVLDSGTIQNVASVAGMDKLTQNGGTLSSSTEMLIAADYIFNGGKLNFHHNPSKPNIAQLNIHGIFEIEGNEDNPTTLSLAKPAFFVPYEPFTLVAADAIDGTFNRIEGIEINENFAWAALYSEDAIHLHAATPGDLNLDQQVDLDDLTILGTFYGNNGTWVNGDVNGDGAVDLNDLTILGTFYGAGSSSQMDFAQALQITGLAQVPEPASALTLAMGIIGLVSRRRRGS